MRATSEVTVIGAGPAGLAVGACLRRAGIDFVILEREQDVGSSWRRHYRRLHLHTVKRFSSLPFLPFPANYPRYVPRQLMVDYLQDYAAKFALRPRFGETVRAVRKDGDDWIVEANSTTVRSPAVVVAAGYNAEPVVPAVAGIDKFRGLAIHSADYVEPAPFAGKSVLVIGMGNTGAEIALDLAEGGARPAISLRDGVHIVPRDLFGLPIQVVALMTRLMPLRATDALFPIILDLYLGNLQRFGIRRPRRGILAQIAQAGKIPVLDVGTVRKIRDGAIKIVPAVAAVGEDGARFADASSGKFDAIIFATGYRANYPDFLPRDVEAAPGGGKRPDAAGRSSGLYFVGYRNAVTGLLREIANEAQAAAADIVRRRRGQRSFRVSSVFSPGVSRT